MYRVELNVNLQRPNPFPFQTPQKASDRNTLSGTQHTPSPKNSEWLVWGRIEIEYYSSCVPVAKEPSNEG